MVHHQLPRSSPDRYSHVFDPLRADWFYLGEVQERRAALDLGAGLGALAMRLACLFDEVVAVDWVWDRLRFAAALWEQEGLPNVTPLYADPAALPLAPASFDLIVMSDQLEWAASHLEACTPEEAQRELLARAWGLLRPGGSICLGVTNRFALRHWLGRSDHGLPPWAGLLPRLPGLPRMKRRPTRAHRARTHSPSAYAELLRAAGFTDVRVYAAFPSHRHPRMMVRFGDRPRLAWATALSRARRARKLGPAAKLAHRLAMRGPLVPLASSLSESLVLWARRPLLDRKTPAQGLPSLLGARLKASWYDLGLNGPGPSSLSIVQLSGNWDRGGKVNWFVFSGDAPHAALVAKLSRTPASVARIKHEHESLLWLRALGPDVASPLPRPLALWWLNGHAVALQECVPWPPLIAGLERLPAQTAVACVLDLCLPFLTALAGATRQGLTPGGTHPYLLHLSQGAQQAAREAQYPPPARELLHRLAQMVLAAPGPSAAVAHHGDLNAADILCNEGRIRVLDWEWLVRRGLPFIDLVSVAISAAAVHGPPAVRETVRALAHHELGSHGNARAVAEAAEAYCRQVGLASAARPALAAAALLNAFLRLGECRISLLSLSLPMESEPLVVAARALLEAGGG